MPIRQSTVSTAAAMGAPTASPVAIAPPTNVTMYSATASEGTAAPNRTTPKPRSTPERTRGNSPPVTTSATRSWYRPSPVADSRLPATGRLASAEVPRKRSMNRPPIRAASNGSAAMRPTDVPYTTSLSTSATSATGFSTGAGSSTPATRWRKSERLSTRDSLTVVGAACPPSSGQRKATGTRREAHSATETMCGPSSSSCARSCSRFISPPRRWP